MTDDEKVLLKSDIRERAIWVLNDFTKTSRRYEYLEERTGISARRWKNLCYRTNHVSPDMLEAIALMRPYLAAWLLTGHALGEQLDPCQDDDLGKALFERALNRSVSQPSDVPPREERRMGVVLKRSPDGGAEVDIPHVINLRAPYEPAGFEWGYDGTGPRELAANMLYHFGLSEKEAERLSSVFAREVLTSLNRERDFLSAQSIQEWISEKTAKENDNQAS